jgi:hypothetical protein
MKSISSFSRQVIFAVSVFSIFSIVSTTLSAQKKSTAPPAKIAGTVYEPGLLKGLKWRNIGPFRAGRSLAVTGVDNDPMTYYAGQVGGGVWKTTDGGNTWLSISDTNFTSSSVGAIAVAKSNPNVLYVGMGEVEMRSNVSFGDGVYKSTDAGKSWKHVGLNNADAIGSIVVHPQNADIAYAAVLGKIFGPSSERGLYRTKDGGASWQNMLKYDDSTGCADVKMDPVNPLILYASMWKAHRTAYSLSSGGKGSGLYKSEDGGDTWKLISENPGMPRGLMGKIICTISPVNHDRLWAVVENSNTGIYRSEDGGKNWELVSTKNDLTQRPWYFSQIFADTKDENTLYVLNVEFFKSIDAGVSWTKISNHHGDNHDMWINPANPKNWIMGDDGGPEITFDGGKNFTDIDLPTAQFYHVNLDNEFPYNVYGAQQDNSSIKIASRTNDYSIGLRDWYPVAGGEAGYIVPDPLNAEITFGGEYDGQFSTYNKTNKQYRVVSVYPEQHSGAGAEDYKYRFNWTFPISFSPHNPKMMYATSNYVHRTLDAGQTWENISPDLTRHDPLTLKPSGGPITLDNTGAEVYATVFAFAESPLKAGVLWAGSDDGLVNVSEDDGKTWTNVTPATLPEWAMISIVEPSHFDVATCYVSATRYKHADSKPYIFKTTDFGKTWKLIINGLPANVYNRCVREDPKKKGLLYCGLETGIYVSFDDGSNWQSLQLNLPNTPVHDIQIQQRENDLVIATHGRSFWILDDITTLYQLSDAVAKDAYHLYQPRTAYRTRGGYNEDPNAQEGTNTPDGVMIRYYLKEKPAKEIVLKFETAAGDSIIHFSSLKNINGEPGEISKDFYESKTKKYGSLSINAGINMFAWDMHYPAAKGDTGVTFEGSFAGSYAVPGNYRVRMFAGDSLIGTQPFTIVADPRNSFTTADLQQQFDLAIQAHNKLNEVGKATKQIAFIRNQLNTYLTDTEDSVEVRAARMVAKPIIDSLTKIEEALYNPKIKANEDDLRFPMRLEEKLGGLNAAILSADAKPTASMQASFASLKSRIDPLLSQLKGLIATDISKFNELAKSKQRIKVVTKMKD